MKLLSLLLLLSFVILFFMVIVQKTFILTLIIFYGGAYSVSSQFVQFLSVSQIPIIFYVLVMADVTAARPRLKLGFHCCFLPALETNF